jgi:hypothetical protein
MQALNITVLTEQETKQNQVQGTKTKYNGRAQSPRPQAKISAIFSPRSLLTVTLLVALGS